MTSERDIILRAAGLKANPSPQAEARILAAAEAAMDRVLEQGHGRRLMLPIAVATAAVVLIGIAGLAGYWVISQGHGGEPSSPAIPSPIATESNRPAVAPAGKSPRAANELALAEERFSNKDVDGLIELLNTGLDQTKVKVAGYLAQIGDEQATPALQRLASLWQGPEEENPFVIALNVIEKRRPIPKKAQDPNHQARETSGRPDAGQKTGIEGVVVDMNSLLPVQQAIVGFTGTGRTTTDVQGRFRLLDAKARDEAFLYVMAPGYASQRLLVRTTRGQMQHVTVGLSLGSRVTGRVVDPNGHPLQGAEVGLFGLPQPDESIVTDALGRYEMVGLDPVVHSYQVHVSHPAYPPVAVSFAPAPAGKATEQDIMLKPGVVVIGQVTDSEGKPVSGVTVGSTESRTMWNSLTDRTNGQGWYRLDCVEAGRLVLWAVHKDYAPLVKHEEVEENPSERRIDMQLQVPRPLVGRVVDTDGNPVAEAIVTVGEYNGVRNLDLGRHACDSDGRFAIANAPGDGELTLWVFGEGVAGQDYRVDLSEDECHITVGRSGRVYGKAIDATTGKPIGVFTVRMAPTETGSPSYGFSATWTEEGCSFTSPQGLFDTGKEALPLKGRYRMTVLAEGYEPLSIDPVAAQPTSDDPNPTVFGLQPGRVTAGRVINREGQPVRAATLVFFSKANIDERSHWPRAISDDAGVFTITALGSGEQCILVTAQQYAPWVGQMAPLMTNTGTLKDIVLDRGASLFGRVTDESGRPVPNARVYALVSLEPILTALGDRFPSLGPDARTDSEGRYQLSGVPIGRVSVEVMSARNYSIGYRQVELKPDEQSELNFGDEPGYTVAGVVTADKACLENAIVVLHSRQTGLKSARTDSEGRFKIPGIPDGIYTLSIEWQPSFVSMSTPWPKDKTFSLHRPLEVHESLDLGVHIEEGSVTGIGHQVERPVPRN